MAKNHGSLGDCSVTVSGETSNTSVKAEVEAECNEAFDWDDFLKLAGSVSAPHHCFKHIEVSLFNGFSPGMKLEVANRENPLSYWVATLISTCGSLLLLRYDGSGGDRKFDFWADISSADLHPIGWCAQTGKTLQPPEHIKHKHEHWVNFLMENLVGARSAPARLLEGPHRGKTVVEMIECGMILEVQDSQHPQHVWVVNVVKNVGGRLLLRYKGLSKNDCQHDFWLFFLDARLHHFGWGKSCGLTMKPPDAICNRYSTKEEWARVLTVSLLGIDESGLVPECIFKDQIKFRHHSVKQSWKLAVLDPVNCYTVRPATIVKIVNDFFFLAELDGQAERSKGCTLLCHSGSTGIFSVDWCVEHKIAVELVGGDGSLFNWKNYLLSTASVAAPSTCFPHCNETHGFEVGMKLEACNPFNLHEICVATVVNIYGGILHLELESSRNPTIKCYYQATSMDIYPAGWCQSNNYPLSAPHCAPPEYTSLHQIPTDSEMKDVENIYETDLPDEVQAIRRVINPSSDSELWCPVLCFNCICKSGPFLNDCDLSRVPKYVGPGNTVLVLKEVLTLLVKAAERPHKLLKDLEDFTVCHWSHPCIIKTKFGGKKYQGTLHIVNTAKDVGDFLQALMSFLRCCPCLLTMGEPVKYCPHECVTTRGRPPLKKFMNKKTLDKKMGLHHPSAVLSQCNEDAPLLSNASDHTRKGKSAVVNSGSSEKRKEDNIAWSCSSPSSIQKLYERLDRKKRIARIKKLHLHSNPLHWTTDDVVEFMESTDCAQWASCFAHQHVDGQALLLLTLPAIQQYLGMKLGEALKVARQIERVKIAFYEKFCG